jgi:hypothetical protein
MAGEQSREGMPESAGFPLISSVCGPWANLCARVRQFLLSPAAFGSGHQRDVPPLLPNPVFARGFNHLFRYRNRQKTV